MVKKYKLVMSWLMIFISLYLWKIGFDYMGLFVMLIGWFFRSDLSDKKYLKNYYDRNSLLIIRMKNISMIMGGVVFLYIAYTITINEYEYLNEHWLMAKLIFLIVSPILIIIVKFEIELYKYYTKHQ